MAKLIRHLYSQYNDQFPPSASLEDAAILAWENSESDSFTLYQAELVEEFDPEEPTGSGEVVKNIRPRYFKAVIESEDFDFDNFEEQEITTK